VVFHKIERQAEVLRIEGFEREAQILNDYASDIRSGDTTNREAAAASLYFVTLFGPGFTRDLENDVNASLNYGYAVLLSRVCRELSARGCLTHMGICHHSEVNSWNFACDLMEPFRPFIDWTVLNVDPIAFDSSMKHRLANVMNATVSYDDGTYKLGSVVSRYVEGCLDALDREIDPDDLKCYRLQ
jgi:CRISPR-associated protein Cas1